MHKLVIRVFIVIMFATLNAHAMKREYQDDECSRQNKKRTKEITFDFSPDTIIIITNNLLLDDLPISFVNKAWHTASFLPFKAFQRVYHQCVKSFAASKKGLGDLSEVLGTLRLEMSILDQHLQQDKAAQQYEYLKKHFLRRHFASLKSLSLSPNEDWTNAELSLFPEKLIQLSLLFLWTPHGLQLDIFDSLPRVKSFRLYANARDLETYLLTTKINQEQMAFATELASKKGISYILSQADNSYLSEYWEIPAILYEIGLFDANVQQIIRAANSHAKTNHMLRACELYDLALMRTPTPEDLREINYQYAAEAYLENQQWEQAITCYQHESLANTSVHSCYLNEGYAQAKLGKFKDAARNFMKYFDRALPGQDQLLPDTVEIMLNVFNQEHDQAYFQYVKQSYGQCQKPKE